MDNQTVNKEEIIFFDPEQRAPPTFQVVLNWLM